MTRPGHRLHAGNCFATRFMICLVHPQRGRLDGDGRHAGKLAPGRGICGDLRLAHVVPDVTWNRRPRGLAASMKAVQRGCELLELLREVPSMIAAPHCPGQICACR